MGYAFTDRKLNLEFFWWCCATLSSHPMKFLTKVSDPLLDKHQDRSLLWLYDATVKDHWDVLPFSHLQLPQYNIPLPKPLTELVTRYITRNAINLPLQLLYFSPLPNIMWKSILCLATTLLYYTKYVFLIVSGYIQILHCGIVGGCQLQKLHPTSTSLHMWKWLFFWLKSQVLPTTPLFVPRNCCS